MTVFDIIVAIVIGACLIFSMLRGMIKEIFSWIAYGAGYLSSKMYSSEVAPFLKEYLKNEMVAKVLAFIFLFLGTSIIIKLIGNGIQKFMHFGGLSGMDRFLGGLLGGAKGAFIIAVLMIPLKFYPDIDKTITNDSITAPYLKQASKYLSENIFTEERINKGVKNMGIEGMQKKIKDFIVIKKLSENN